jgi:co-chaperonin GroES (HSP10)
MITEAVQKGQWFEYSGKMRKAMDDIPAGWTPWLDPYDVGAFKAGPLTSTSEPPVVSRTLQAEAAPANAPANPTGIQPTEFKVLIAPTPVTEKVGSILMPEQTKETEKWATVEGTLIACSPLAFTYAKDDEWEAAGGQKPKPGDRVLFAKYAGHHHKGSDGQTYIIANDKDVMAVLS